MSVLAKPDTIAVRMVSKAELNADTADLRVVVKGSTVFSGNEAFKKAKELRALLKTLKEIGIDENRVKLRSVEINSQSFALIKTSSAKYVVTIKKVSLEMLPTVLGAVASHKGAQLSQLTWNYGKLKETRSSLRREAILDSLSQARKDAELLAVEVLGIHSLTETTRENDYNREHIRGENISLFGAARQHSQPEIGFHLGNSTTVTLEIVAEFRVAPVSTE